MTLPAGTKLGPYEVLSPIGAGGMGEVYRARDTKLQRDVAIKVLPERLAESPQALSRFEREARIVAALSHPNILAIHDLGQEATTAYAVMELLEGGTLRDEIRGGPLPPRKAVGYAAQAAEGLAAAHEKGVVHRDLKPENLFVTRDGRLKILDFGLAREERGAAAASETESPTLVRETDPGTVVGTVGYMAPEQVRGDTADHRADIFSLGCVLHEMLTGQRTFHRDTAAETMTAILRDDPGPLADSGRAIPPALERIVSHCLEKKPAQRFQSARDLAFDLASVSGNSIREATIPARAGARPWPWLGAAVAALLLILAGFEAGRRAATKSAGASAPRAHFTQLTDLPGVEASPSLSPDGKTLVFVGRPDGDADIYLQRVGGHNPINLTADCQKDDGAPAFSPDGERIAFHSECEAGGTFVMGATGESRRRIADKGYDPAWSPDGRRLAVVTEPAMNPLFRQTNSELWIVEIASAAKRRLLEEDAMQPSWSPSGHRIAFWGLRGGQGGAGRRDIWTVSAEGGEPAPVTNDEAVDWNPVWSADGRHLYFASGRGGTLNLWRVPIDEVSGRTLGPPEPFTAPSRSSGGLSLSRDATRLAFVAREEWSTLHRVAFDPDRVRLAGTPELILGGSRVISSLGLSPDGQWLVWSSGGLRENLFVIRLDGTGYRQITDDEFRNRGPQWSADGSTISFYSNRSGRYQVWSVRPDGSGIEPLTAITAGSVRFSEWSYDGTRVAISGSPTTRLFDPRKPLLERELLTLPPMADDLSFHAVSWSPDGARLAGVGQHADGLLAGIFLHSLKSGSYQRVAGGGRNPSLLADGRRLLYEDGGSIVFLDPATGRTATLLSLGMPLQAPLARAFRVSRDNRWIAFYRTEAEADIWLMSLE
jgi:Tol biopolymer transport system component